MTNCTKILQSHSDSRTDTMYQNLQELEVENFYLGYFDSSRSEQSTGERITKKLICCLSWSGREDLSADLFARNISNLTTRAVRSKEYDRTVRHIIERPRARTSPWFFGYFWKCSKIAEFCHVGFVLPETHCSVVFFAGLLFVLEK